MECNLCDFIFEVQITWGHTEQFQHFRNCLYSDLQTTSRETYHRSWLCHIWEPPVSSPSRLVLVSVPGFMTFVTYLSHFSYLRTYHPHQDCSQSLCRLTNIPVGFNWIFWDISPQEQVRDWIGARESIEANISIFAKMERGLDIKARLPMAIGNLKKILGQKLKSERRESNLHEIKDSCEITS